MSSADFDNEVLKNINKKNAIEAMSGLYPHLPPAMIEQMYDFCSSPQHKDKADLLYYESNYENLSAGELKKYYKLKNRYMDFLSNIPKHRLYTPDEIIHDAITIGERLPEPIEPPKADFIPDETRVVPATVAEVHEADLNMTLSGSLVV